MPGFCRRRLVRLEACRATFISPQHSNSQFGSRFSSRNPLDVRCLRQGHPHCRCGCSVCLTIGYSWLETLDRATQSCSAYQSFRDLLATCTERLVSRIYFTPSTIIHASCAGCSASAPQLTFRGIKDVAAYGYIHYDCTTATP